MAKRDLRDATITIRDGDSPAAEVVVKIGTGNATWTENSPMEYEPEKGSIALGTVRKADDVPTELSVTCRWEQITSEYSGSSEGATPYEILKNHGTFDFVTSGADPCEPYSVEIEIAFVPSCSTTGVAERVKFNEFRVETCTFDPQAGTLAFSGKSKEVTPTYDRPLPPVNSVAPAITGTLEVDETLTVTNGTWTGGTFLSRQWYRNPDPGDADNNIGNISIDGETDTTYVLQAGDEGYYIVCIVTYENAYGTSYKLSNVVGLIDP